MSYAIGSEPARTHNDQQKYHDAEGQQHDRIQLQKQDTSSMAASNVPDITVTQRMISATWGSVLTSLLGRFKIEVEEPVLTDNSNTT
jgi:hypothetical protein